MCHVQGGLLSQAWGVVVGTLLLLFVLSIINDTAKHRLVRERERAHGHMRGQQTCAVGLWGGGVLLQREPRHCFKAQGTE